MFPAAMSLTHIKDLKDLSVFLVGGTIDMQVLTDLKRGFHKRAFQKLGGRVPRHRTFAGDRPPRYGTGEVSLAAEWPPSA